MNVTWIYDGRKFTILGTIGILLSLFAILTTDNTLWAALFGVMIPIFGIITIKSAIGWSWKRAAEKRRKERLHDFHS